MTDSLLDGLRDLAEPAPATLTERVVDGWVRAESPLGEVYAVVGADGVRLLRTAACAGDLEEFLEGYRARHGRPVRPAPRTPRGLLPALRGTGVMGLPFAWVVLGLLVYPAVVLTARWYVRATERLEADFSELVSRR